MKVKGNNFNTNMLPFKRIGMIFWKMIAIKNCSIAYKLSKRLSNQTMIGI